MYLEFPPLSGGASQGLADAGIETFEGDYAHYVVRETIQNSLDAKSDSCDLVEVSFTHQRLAKSDLPFFDDLARALNSTKEMWGGSSREDRFFNEVSRQLSDQRFDVIRIEDRGTKGVSGDEDDARSPWSRLVQQRFASAKTSGTAAGSFGIGKDAPLAASAFRTVLYSTMTEDGQVAFQGVCRLATHKNKQGKKTQQTGFIGEQYDDDREIHPALRNASRIPEIFKRSRPGLSLWLLGFRYGGEDWRDRFLVAAIINFWPAIQRGSLRVTVQNETIDQSSLGAFIGRLSTNKKIKEISPYYEAEIQPDKRFEKDLPIAGQCQLSLKTDPDYPRRIKMTRKSGMIIDDYRPRGSLIPFAGHFSCLSKTGNERLRVLEPPAHDKWDKSRGGTPEEKKIVDEIHRWIRECIKKLNPESHQTSFTENQLSKIIPPISPENLPETGKGAGESGIDGAPQDQINPSITKFRPKVLVKTDGTSGEDKGDSGGGNGEENEKGEEGDGTNTGGRLGNQGDQGGGGDGPSGKRSKVKSFRAFATGDESETYTLVVRGNQGAPVSLQILSHSDDGRTSPLSVRSVVDKKTGKVVEHSGNTIKGIAITEDNEPLILNITPSISGSYSIGIKVS